MPPPNLANLHEDIYALLLNNLAETSPWDLLNFSYTCRPTFTAFESRQTYILQKALKVALSYELGDDKEYLDLNFAQALYRAELECERRGLVKGKQRASPIQNGSFSQFETSPVHLRLTLKSHTVLRPLIHFLHSTHTFWLHGPDDLSGLRPTSVISRRYTPGYIRLHAFQTAVYIYATSPAGIAMFRRNRLIAYQYHNAERARHLTEAMDGFREAGGTGERAPSLTFTDEIVGALAWLAKQVDTVFVLLDYSRQWRPEPDQEYPLQVEGLTKAELDKLKELTLHRDQLFWLLEILGVREDGRGIRLWEWTVKEGVESDEMYKKLGMSKEAVREKQWDMVHAILRMRDRFREDGVAALDYSDPPKTKYYEIR